MSRSVAIEDAATQVVACEDTHSVAGSDADEANADDHVNARASASPTAEDEEKGAPRVSAQDIRKPSSSYFLFAAHVRAELAAAEASGGAGKTSVAETAKLIGTRWKALTPEEKAPWLERANADKARYHSEMIAAGLDPKKAQGRSRGQAPEVDLDPQAYLEKFAKAGPAFPVARMRKLAKLDDDVKNIKGDAMLLIVKATELFVGALAEQALKSSTTKGAKAKTRTLQGIDVHHAAYVGENLDFLTDDLEPPATLVANADKAKRAQRRRTEATKPTEAEGIAQSALELAPEPGGTTARAPSSSKGRKIPDSAPVDDSKSIARFFATTSADDQRV